MTTGFWCLGYDSCMGRAQNEPDQVSSNGWSTTTEVGGIFSRDVAQNPVWANANFAYIRYCSSDAWMGNGEAFGMQFRGQALVHATIQDLVANQGLGAGSRLLLGGCSAGARGTMTHLDNVAAVLENFGVEVRGMLDSSLWVNVQPASSDALGGSLLEQSQLVYEFANTTGILSPECQEAYPLTPWYCMFGQYRMPFLQSPYFLSQSQLDDFQLGYDCDTTTTTDAAGTVHTQVTSEEESCVDGVQSAIRGALSELPALGQQAVGIFSSTCSLHCVTNGPDWWTITVDGQSMASLMTSWYYGGDEPYAVDSCTGSACMAQCLTEEQQFPSGDFGSTGGQNRHRR